MRLDSDRSHRLPFGVALVAAVTLLGAIPAGAAEDDQLSVTPSTAGDSVRPLFSYQAERGSVIDDSITLINKSDNDLTVELYAVDAAVTTDGTFAPTRRADIHDTVGAWVSLSESAVTIAAGDAVDVEFRFVVPDLAEPGDYAGVIIAQLEASGEQTIEDGDVRLSVETAVGVRLFARVAGDLRPGLAVSGVRLESEGSAAGWFGASVPMRVEYTVTNTGNTRVVPITSAEVHGPFGWRRVLVPDETLPDLLPGGSVTVSEEVGDIAPSLLIQADVAVRSPDGLTASSSTGRRLLVPWVALVFAVLFLVWASRQARTLRSFIRDVRKKDSWEMTR
jgi:hypothetical protein